MWGQINIADANMHAEGCGGGPNGQGFHGLREADGDRVREICWPTRTRCCRRVGHARRWPSPEAKRCARGGLPGLRASPAEVRQSEGGIGDVVVQPRQGQSGAHRSAVTAREDTGPPWPLWIVIFMTSAMVVGTVIIYGVERAGLHYPMVIIVGRHRRHQSLPHPAALASVHW